MSTPLTVTLPSKPLKTSIVSLFADEGRKKYFSSELISLKSSSWTHCHLCHASPSSEPRTAWTKSAASVVKPVGLPLSAAETGTAENAPSVRIAVSNNANIFFIFIPPLHYDYITKIRIYQHEKPLKNNLRYDKMEREITTGRCAYEKVHFGSRRGYDQREKHTV